MSHPAPVTEITHRLVSAPAGRIHLVEQGSGPLVLLVHGFPESWYSWRHQLPVLAASGHRAVAVDVRGYGRSSKPEDAAAYRMLELVEDNVAVVHALGERTAVIVGHDWGATIAANSALVRPDVFRAVGLLSVPYAPRGGPRPSEVFARMGGEEEFYVSYFQEPGRAESEIEPDVRGWLAGFYAALSADTMPPADAPDPHFAARGGTLRDRFPAGRLPAWLTEDDLDVYAAEFERTGMSGALGRYRNMDRDWEDLADFDGSPITQPSLFAGGALDASTTWMADAIKAYPSTLPGLMSSHILDGCGHWIQQERHEEVNQILTGWLASLPACLRVTGARTKGILHTQRHVHRVIGTVSEFVVTSGGNVPAAVLACHRILPARVKGDSRTPLMPPGTETDAVRGDRASRRSVARLLTVRHARTVPVEVPVESSLRLAADRGGVSGPPYLAVVGVDICLETTRHQRLPVAFRRAG